MPQKDAARHLLPSVARNFAATILEKQHEVQL
jgi:hypothetical protein